MWHSCPGQRWFKYSTGVQVGVKKKETLHLHTKDIRGIKLQSKQKTAQPACTVVYRSESGKPWLNLTQISDFKRLRY